MIRFISRFAIPTSIFLGFTFFGAGMAKLYVAHSYFGWIGPVWLEERLEPYQLAVYARFIAYSQVVIGYLLLTLRFRTLGAIMSVPLIINILMVTVSLQWQGTPFVVSVLLLMAIYLLWVDRDRLLPIIGLPSKWRGNYIMTRKGSLVWLAGLCLNLLSIKLSVFHIYAAWFVSMIGVGMSFWSLKMDRSQATS